MIEVYGIRPRTTQPLHSVRLSERNPSNAAWLRFWNFADSSGGHAPRELTGARKDSWTFRTNAKRGGGGPLGSGLYTGGGNYNDGGAYCDDAYRTQITTAMTAVVLFTSVSSTNSEFIFGNTSLINGVDYNWGLYRSHSTATLAAFVKNSGGTGVGAGGASNLMPVGRSGLAVMTYDGATIRVYLDGILVGTAAQTGNVRTTDLSTTLCDWYGATQSQAMWIYYAGVANRVWAPEEVAELGANPWSLFEEEEEPVFYSLPSGITFSYTATGGITFSGASVESRQAARQAAGGVQFAGSADYATVGLQTRSVVASGGLSSGGSALVNRHRTHEASGGAQFGGAATVSTVSGPQTRTVTASGGIVFGGSANGFGLAAGGGTTTTKRQRLHARAFGRRALGKRAAGGWFSRTA